MMFNSHVLKWYRWRIFVLTELRRPIALTFWIEWYNEELARTPITELESQT